MIILIFIIAHWYLSLFSQTFFLHRYAAHKMFDISKFWEKMFYIFTYITQGSSYLSPYAYGVMHRMHHAYADTEKDPHSPKYDKNLFSMMWRTKDEYTAIFNKKNKIEEQFTLGVPQWESFEKIAHSWVSRLLWIVQLHRDQGGLFCGRREPWRGWYGPRGQYRRREPVWMLLQSEYWWRILEP